MKKVLYIFGELLDDDIDWLVRFGHVLHVERDHILIQKGQPAAEMFIILNGRLKAVVNEQVDGMTFVMSAGEIIGEISFADSRPPTATVKVIEPGHVLAISRSLLTERLQTNEGFSGRFYKGLAVFLAYRLREVESRLSPQVEADFSELDDDLTNRLSLAGKRFERMLQATIRA